MTHLVTDDKVDRRGNMWTRDQKRDVRGNSIPWSHPPYALFCRVKHHFILRVCVVLITITAAIEKCHNTCQQLFTLGAKTLLRPNWIMEPPLSYTSIALFWYLPHVMFQGCNAPVEGVMTKEPLFTNIPTGAKLLDTYEQWFFRPTKRNLGKCLYRSDFNMAV